MTSRAIHRSTSFQFAQSFDGSREEPGFARTSRASRSERSSRTTDSARSSRSGSSIRSTRSGRPARSGQDSKGSGWMQKTLGVPARFMEPRVQLMVVVILLVLFGLVMVYSASSIEAMNEIGQPAYYLIRQLALAAAGFVFIAIEVRVGYHNLCGRFFKPLWAVMTFFLLLTAALGIAGGGAVRWIRIAGIGFQPSEFAKVGIVVTFALICQRFFEDKTINFKQFLIYVALGIGIPLALIIKQPDKGTTLIMCLTLFVMLSTTGMKLKPLLPVFIVFAIAALALGLHDDYSRARIMTMFDPWSDRFGAGYQVTQGFIAFGNGGLFGRGIGQSMQKYSFLPEAHNDFIFAVVGEECGLVGTVVVVLAFVAILWLSFKIARNAPDLCGKLVASGAASVLCIQFLINVGGILGLTPMTGKPLPFLSYGGSSILSCLILVGLIISVSESSVLPETTYDRARGRMSLTAGGGSAQSGYNEGGGVSDFGRKKDFTVFSGGASGARRPERINLGPSSAERLRTSDGGPQVRNRTSRGSSRPRTRR